MRSLRREGIAVDAYLDLRDNDVKGSGMTLKTDYLIIGEPPDLSQTKTYKKDDPRIERKTGIAPFDRPVVPDVYRIAARSSGARWTDAK